MDIYHECSCFLCKKHYSTKHALIKHLEVERTRQVGNEEMLKAIATAMEQLRVRRGTERHACPDCGRSFDNAYYRQRHGTYCCPEDPEEGAVDYDALPALRANLKGGEGEISDAGSSSGESSGGSDSLGSGSSSGTEELPPLSAPVPVEKVPEYGALLMPQSYLPTLLRHMSFRELHNHLCGSYDLVSSIKEAMVMDIEIFDRIFGEKPPGIRVLHRRKRLFERLLPNGQWQLITGEKLVTIHTQNMKELLGTMNGQILQYRLNGDDSIFQHHPLETWCRHMLRYSEPRYQAKVLSALVNAICT